MGPPQKSSDSYRQRLLDPVLDTLLEQAPALFLIGPRATGKTTTARRRAASVVQLDSAPQAAAFHADPDAALAGLSEPILLDEWQAVPQVLGAVKRSVDRDPHPGRFLITGSAQAQTSPNIWPGTGRLITFRMWGLSEREIAGGNLTTPSFIERLTAGDEFHSSKANLNDYISMFLRGGFPEIITETNEDFRFRWLQSYVDQLITRDLSALGVRRDPFKFRALLEAACSTTATDVTEATLYGAAGALTKDTGSAYLANMQALSILDVLPGWHSNRLKRLIKSPKRYVTDTALAGVVLDLDNRAVLRDGTLLGRLLESFVVAQLRIENAVATRPPRMYHLRTAQGRQEVDVLAEVGAGNVVGIEIKSTATPSRDDAKHLIWLRDQLGDRFLRGAVLHTGPVPFELDDRILALPISSIWSS